MAVYRGDGGPCLPPPPFTFPSPRPVQVWTQQLLERKEQLHTDALAPSPLANFCEGKKKTRRFAFTRFINRGQATINSLLNSLTIQNSFSPATATSVTAGSECVTDTETHREEGHQRTCLFMSDFCICASCGSWLTCVLTQQKTCKEMRLLLEPRKVQSFFVLSWE